MKDELEKMKINISSADGAFIFGCFATFWLTIEDPDIIDAVISFLMK